MCLRRVLGAALVLASLASCGIPGTVDRGPALPTARIALQTARPAAAITPAPPAATAPHATTQPPTATPVPSLIPTPAEPTPAPSLTPAPSTTLAPALETPAPGPDADQVTREALLVAAINQTRTANGLPPYLHSPELSAAARGHSCDIGVHGMISHTSSDGRTLAQRLAGSDPPWEWPSESIAAGIDDPAAVVALWMDEPPEGWHRRNILSGDQREVGAGYCYIADDPTGNHHYWTADFSRRRGSP